MTTHQFIQSDDNPTLCRDCRCTLGKDWHVQQGEKVTSPTQSHPCPNVVLLAQAQAEIERLRAVVEPLRYFNSILRERDSGDAEALEQAYRRVMWRLADYEDALESAQAESSTPRPARPGHTSECSEFGCVCPVYPATLDGVPTTDKAV